MKKGLLLFVAILACFALAAQAAPVIKGIPMEGGATVTKAPTGKAPAGAVAVGPMGYADAWRTVAANQGKSIVSNAAGTSIQVLYSQNSGTATPSNLTWGYSDDGGATWSNQTIVSDRNSRTYSGISVASDFTPFLVWQDRTSGAPWPICLTFDDSGYGGGFFNTPVHLNNDSGTFNLPGMSIQDNGTSSFNLYVYSS